MFTAWRTAHFMRGKLPHRVPSVRKAKRTATPDRPQSSAEVLSIMRQLVAMTNKPASAGGTNSPPPPTEPPPDPE